MRLSNCLLKKKNSKSEIQLVYKFMKGQTEVTYNWKQPFCVFDSIIFLKNNLIYNNGRSIQNILKKSKQLHLQQLGEINNKAKCPYKEAKQINLLQL